MTIHVPAAQMPRRGTSRLDSRARVHPRPPASAALAVPAVARLPREQAGTVNIASGAQARRAVRAGAANAERGRALGAGRVGARASAPWSGPGGREPTRPLGDLRAGQQPGAQDEHPASTRRLAASAAALAHGLPVRAAAQRVCAPTAVHAQREASCHYHRKEQTGLRTAAEVAPPWATWYTLKTRQ